jgi:hypothetical protein
MGDRSRTVKKLKSRNLFLCLFILFGVLSDFLIGGVFKIIWPFIYVPTYFVIAMTMGNYLTRIQFQISSQIAIVTYLSGAAIGHLWFVQHHSYAIYPMEIAAVSTTPLVLKSAQFPELLFVSSHKLTEALAAQTPAPQTVPVVVEITTDYLCVRSFIINSVAGIDVKLDADAAWTWRANYAGLHNDLHTGPTMPTDNKRWPWCRYQFYRPSN